MSAVPEFQLHATALGKRYNSQWIFRNFNGTYTTGDAVAITGGNGSGKSTLLKILAGAERFSEGEYILYSHLSPIAQEHQYRYVSLCAPYQSLYEDLTAEEHYKLHSNFKKLSVQSAGKFWEKLQLPEIARKQPLKNFSSGMRQRVKLALAILSTTPLLYLDEPVSNFDKEAIKWYQNLLEEYRHRRIIFVASNLNEDELFLCNHNIEISAFKDFKGK